MAKVKITGHASGSGVLTVTAPNTSTDRTITLPDATGTLATTADTTDLDGAITINESGADVDFRVESDTITNALFVDGAKGNVGIGVTPETWENGWTGLQVGGLGAVVSTSAQSASGNTWVTNNMYINGAGQLSYIVTDEASRHRQNNGKHYFDVAASGTADAAISFNEVMKIENDGQFRVSGNGSNPSANTGTGQASGNGGFMVNKSGGMTMAIQDQNSYFNFTGTASDAYWKFRWGGSDKGSIVWTSSATAYNTSSDYRLKEDVQPMSASIERLKQLKPVNFAWIEGGDGTRVDGFLAHEAQEVVPEAITGTKDAMMTEEYEVTPAVMDGETEVTPAVIGTRSVPDMQGIDQSKLVPLLTSALQEAVAKIEELTTRIETLEAE